MQEGWRWFKCWEVRQIAKNCPTKNDEYENQDVFVNLALVTVDSADLKVTGNSLKSNKWVPDSYCSPQICNNRTRFSDFVKCDVIVQVLNNEMISFWDVKKVQIISNVHLVKRNVTLQDASYLPGITHNLISISQARKSGFCVLSQDSTSARHEWMDMQ